MINAISNNMYSVPVYNSSKVFDYSAAVNNANKQALELLESLQAKNKPLFDYGCHAKVYSERIDGVFERVHVGHEKP